MSVDVSRCQYHLVLPHSSIPQLFSVITSYKWLPSVILFLNKRDLFEEKVLYVDISEFFPEYTGPTQDAEQGKYFFKSLYMDIHEEQMLSRTKEKPLFIHFTCATDTNNISIVFEDIKCMLLRQHLGDLQL